jgi:hypothetical protein
VSTFPEDKQIQTPTAGRDLAGKREKPFDGRWFARLDDVVQSVHPSETEGRKETGDVIE